MINNKITLKGVIYNSLL